METTFDEKFLTTKFNTVVSPTTTTELVTHKIETTKMFSNEDQEPINPITTQFYDEDHITTKYTTPQFYSDDTAYPKTTLSQLLNKDHVTVQSTTPQTYSKDHVTEGKTITVAGESGRISISSVSSETPSTARIFTEDLSSTLKSSIPITEEKFINTRYITKSIPRSTVSPNPNIIDDSVTESVLRVTPTDKNSRVTIAAVSQPRPFGFPRRTRPTTASTPIITEVTQSSVIGLSSTSRSKVSTRTRNLTRSTTKAPRTRTRTHSRNREKSVSSVDDEHIKPKDETLKNSSDLLDDQKDIQAVSSSRLINSRRGSSRFRSQRTQYQDLNTKTTDFNNEIVSSTTEYPSRRQRRPQKTTSTTITNDLKNYQISSEKPSRRRNSLRTLQTKFDQQTADTFDNRAEVFNTINGSREPIILTSTFKPLNTRFPSFKYDIFESVKDDLKKITTNLKKIDDRTDKIDVRMDGPDEMTTQTENTRFLIEVTEPVPTENIVEDETFNSFESSLTTVPSNSLSRYLTTIEDLKNDVVQTTLLDTTTDSTITETLSYEKNTGSRTSLAATTKSTEVISTTTPITFQKTRKVQSRKRPSSTTSTLTGLNEETKNSSRTDKNNSNRKKVAKRLRLLTEASKLNSTDLEQRENLKFNEEKPSRRRNSTKVPTKDNKFTISDDSVSLRTSDKIFYIRKKTGLNSDDNSTPKIEVSDDIDKKRKNFLYRYRASSSQTDNNIEKNEQTDEKVSTSKIYDSTEKTEDSNNLKVSKSSLGKSKFDNVNEKNYAKTQTAEGRRSRTSFRNFENETQDIENSTNKNKLNFSFSKSTSTTEDSVQETLIPTKKFDYFADARKRGSQLYRTTQKLNSQNYSVSTTKPLVTRLVTSIIESGTTERQKISIKKKYSSLTSTTYIPKPSTGIPHLFLRKQKEKRKNILSNEIPRGYSTEQSVDYSTLPIESEFLDKKFTTESGEESSSTIEIESVFSNLIGH